jgi:small multidrug resistance pump
MLNWIFLGIAIVFEVAGTTSLKLANGGSSLRWLFTAFGLYGVSLLTLSLALRSLPVGVAYAIWAGIGTVLVVIIGTLVFQETATPFKLACIALIVAGTVGLHLNVQGA